MPNIPGFTGLQRSSEALSFARVVVQVPQTGVSLKNLPARVGDIRHMGSVPSSGRSSGGGNGNPLQYSCLENPKDRGAWRAAVHGVAKSQT